MNHFCEQLSVCFLAVFLVLILPATSALNLTVIHNNDFHTRYTPIKEHNLAECDLDSNSTDCIGGAARTVAEVKHLRTIAEKDGGHILFLNAGDHFQGTFWYSILKSQVVAEFVSLMKHDVMALGNHEFDDGPEELNSFVDKVSTDPNLSILSCNIIVNPSSPLAGKVHNSTIRTIAGIPVAIIGYTTPDTKFLSKPGSTVTFRDEIEAIREEIARLKAANPKLNIFIGVGHSGYQRDKEIAHAIDDLDLVVGAHSHSFLWSGSNVPSSETPEGEYPTVIKHASGEQTLVVQAFAYGKYLGKLDLMFDENGRVQHYQGLPIFLDSSFEQDAQTKELVDKLYSQLSADLFRQIGFTEVDLESPESCRFAECNIGNMIADAFASYFDKRLRGEEAFESQCNTTLSIINGGNIRSSIGKGKISYKDVISTMPFNNQQGLLRATGRELVEIFEHSARQYRRGGFMQMSSGLRVIYNQTGGEGEHQQLVLHQLQVKCQQGWQPVDNDVTYLIAMNAFIANGGDNYTMINGTNWTDYGLSDSETIIKYIEGVQNVTAVNEGRVQIRPKDSPSSAATVLLSINMLVLLALIQFTWNHRYT